MPVPDTSELLIKITGQAIECHLSVDGGDYRPLSEIDAARLLSDLACATTAGIVAGYEGGLPIGGAGIGAAINGDC